ncbi:elongation protein 1 [Cavenderia fasciculata]|uniref:Elongator complex protein 1 n=1 Tax=Cavenderia fasciculata TaxID=261658 RepID=F4PKF5_CACFS|nr:elongation protein 1 [Cavenderia fasciculata]EGG24079.1 elongation protein 1 [Cavenderia fasciculata]|eukprot:XP_004361930.1 elongation protein 1 [Cavenderia fasciculata]
MRNITRLVELGDQLPISEITHFTVDNVNSIIYLITKSNLFVAYNPTSKKVQIQIELNGQDILSEGAEIVSMQFIPDCESVCVASSKGDILMYNVVTSQLECVGIIGSGIVAMSWSPDYELLILATESNTLVQMTKDWDILNEVAIDSLLPGNKLTANIITNSNLPQAQYSKAQFAQSTLDKPNNNNEKTQSISFTPKISWRGDGQYFVCSAYDEKSGRVMLKCHSADDRFVAMAWDNGTTQTLRTVSRNGVYQQYTFCWDYDVSKGSSAANPSLVVMVDGNTLKVTPFRRLVVPPPLSAYQIGLPAACSAFAFSHDFSIAVLTTDNTMAIYTPATLPPIPAAGVSQPLPNYSVAPKLVASIKVPASTLQLCHLRHLTWVPETNTLVAVDSHSKLGSDQIVEINFSINEQVLVLDRIHRTTTNSHILRLVSYHYDGAQATLPADEEEHQLHPLGTKDKVIFETVDGSVYDYHLINMGAVAAINPFTIDHAAFKFSTPCVWISSAIVGGEESIIGLNDRNRLYINNTLVAPDCNNFTLHNKFILFTTISHLLRSVPLSLAASATTPVITATHPLTGKTSTAYDDSVREVERGARVVCAVPHDTRVILQMPRGNLEAIAPRSLTLSTIREMLDAHQYGKAFATMRRNRIDMNFIYDHNPQDFLKHIDIFIDQVPQIDFLNLFITTLREDDTTKTLFVDLEKPSSAPQKTVTGTTTANKESKVNIICDRLREELIKKDSIKFNLPILTTYVKKSPPEYDQVLRKVQSLRGEEITEHGETIVNRLAEESLDYIVFLVDVNKLYDVALGTYDFELVIMVAQKSQKDPKEYMAFLTQLQSMEPNYQKYAIDCHLERWSLALQHLAATGPEHFDQCLELIGNHQLYQEGVRLFAGKPDQLKRIQDAFGDYLVSTNKNVEAAYVYNAAGQDKKALQAFKEGGVFNMAVLVAKRLGLSALDLAQMSNEMADFKRRASFYQEASAIYASAHCNHDYENAINTLCEGGFWTDAYALAVESNHVALLDSSILIQLQTAAETTEEELQESLDTYKKQFVRLGIVRTTKLNHVPLRLPGGGGSGMGDDTTSMMSGMSGMFSEHSGMSGMSGMSANTAVTTSSYRSTYSSATGTFSQATRVRNKPKKEGRKKINKIRVKGKEGSIYEEEFLVDAMKKTIPTASKQELINQLLRGLVLFNMTSEAQHIEKLFGDLIIVIDESLNLLSQSATAIHPDNVKEEQRIQDIEYQHQQRLSNPLLNELHHQHQQQSNQQQHTLEKSTIHKITITRDNINWALDEVLMDLNGEWINVATCVVHIDTRRKKNTRGGKQ